MKVGKTRIEEHSNSEKQNIRCDISILLKKLMAYQNICFLAQHVFLILIFRYITQNYILAELALMFLLCVVPDKFVCVFLFFVLLWGFIEFDTQKNK